MLMVLQGTYTSLVYNDSTPVNVTTGVYGGLEIQNATWARYEFEAGCVDSTTQLSARWANIAA